MRLTAAVAALGVLGGLALVYARQEPAEVVGAMAVADPVPSPTPTVRTPATSRTAAPQRSARNVLDGEGGGRSADRSPAPPSAAPTGAARPAPRATTAPPRLLPRPVDLTVALRSGATVSLEPLAQPGSRVRHEDGRVRAAGLDPASTLESRANAHFTVRAGLADPDCVSLEATDRPQAFLRHRDFIVRLDRADGTALFAADATFCPVAGLAGRYTSLRSFNYPGRHLSDRGSRLFLDPTGRSTAATRAMTFAVRPKA